MNIIVTNYITEPLIDYRVNSKCYYIQMKILDYLNIVDLEGNPYQRGLLEAKVYKKLISDILEGAVFPPISVVYPEIVDLIHGFEDTKKFKILDGLQRTNCLIICKKILSGEEKLPKEENIDIKYKNVDEFLDRLITLEVWENLDLKAILYKIVVLNTGQRRMDTRHQLDILFYSLQETLTKQGIRVKRLKEKEQEELGSKELYESNTFSLSSIAEALVSYINKIPSYSQKDAANFLFETLSLGENEFEGLIKSVENSETYSNLTWVLKTLSDNLMEKYRYNILIKYNLFLTGVLAAMGYSVTRVDGVFFEEKKKNLINLFKDNVDPLKLNDFQIYHQKFESGIGVKRRKLVYKAFLNFFLSKSVNEINWREAYEEIEGKG